MGLMVRDGATRLLTMRGRQYRKSGSRIMVSRSRDKKIRNSTCTAGQIVALIRLARACKGDAAHRHETSARVAMDAVASVRRKPCRRERRQRTAKSCGPGAATLALRR